MVGVRHKWKCVLFLVVVKWMGICVGNPMEDIDMLPKCPATMIDKYTKDYRCANVNDVEWTLVNKDNPECKCPDDGVCYASLGDMDVVENGSYGVPNLEEYFQFKCISRKIWDKMYHLHHKYTHGLRVNVNY